MKRLVIVTVIVCCFTIGTTTYAQGTKVAVVDIHKLLTATPFGEEYKKVLTDQHSYPANAIQDLKNAIANFPEMYQNELTNASKQIDPNIDLVIIVRAAILDEFETLSQNKVIYKTDVKFFPVLRGGYFNDATDITDKVSVKFMALMGN